MEALKLRYSGLILSAILCSALPLLSYAAPVSYSATAVPQSYGSTTACTSPLTGIINVPDSFVIDDINVRFIASHPYRSDTNFSITSPDGTVVDLLTGPYGTSADNYNVTFDDDASVVADTGTHNVNQLITGPGVDVLSESDPLSDFNTENALGDWTYSICDVYTAADNGTVLEISLLFDLNLVPELEATKTITVYPPSEYALPGADVIYTISATNIGEGVVDDGSVIVIDSIPAELTFYNGDMDDGGTLTSDPVAFDETGSGLTFAYASDVAYSNLPGRPADMTDCTYVPSAGYDADITHICVNPKGEFKAGTSDPTFSISFRARVN